MAIINPPIPEIGQPNASEDADIRSAIVALLALVNGGLDGANIADGSITSTELAAAVLVGLHEPGDVKASARAAPSSGWLLCDGSAVSRTGATAALFAAIGTAYGVGDGATTFNLPDLRGRAPVGKGTHVDIDVLGESDGLAVGSRRPKHNHGAAGAHAHAYLTGVPSAGVASNAGAGGGIIIPADNHFHGGNTAVDGGHTHADDGPAYQVVNYMIKT